jgi:hypothetical protein
MGQADCSCNLAVGQVFLHTCYQKQRASLCQEKSPTKTAPSSSTVPLTEVVSLACHHDDDDDVLQLRTVDAFHTMGTVAPCLHA